MSGTYCTAIVDLKQGTTCNIASKPKRNKRQEVATLNAQTLTQPVGVFLCNVTRLITLRLADKTAHTIF